LVNSWQRKGEKYVLLYIPNARHAWDASDAVDVTEHTATAQYFENGFAGSVEAGKKIMSGDAARIRAAPADLLEREGPLLVGAPRVQLPRAGTCHCCSAAEAARCGRATDFDTDAEDIPGGYGANHEEEQESGEKRHPMEDSDSDEPAPPLAARGGGCGWRRRRPRAHVGRRVGLGRVRRGRLSSLTWGGSGATAGRCSSTTPMGALPVAALLPSSAFS
jgi:hypothetical protein